MNKFLLLKIKGDTPAEPFVDGIVRLGLMSVPFLGKRIHLRRFEAQRALLFAVEAGDPVGAGAYNDYDDRGALAFYGLPLEPSRPLERRPSWAAQLRAMLAARGVDAMHDHLRGSYAVAALKPGGELTAFVEFTGLKPLYYLETDRVVAVSNRQMLLNLIARGEERPTYDLEALAWLPAQANVFGDRMVHRGVRLLLPGSYLETDAEGRTQVKALTHRFWHPLDGEYGPVTGEHLDRAADAITQNCVAIDGLATPHIHLALTGGKDSRVNFAGALQSGLAKRLDIFTRGPDESPEIECAAHLCKHYNLKHRPIVLRRSEFDAGRLWDRMRYQAYQCEGTVCPWDGVGELQKKTIVGIHGFVGSLYRRSHVKALQNVVFDNVEDARRVFENYQQPSDPLGIVWPHWREAQRRHMNEWIDSRLDAGVPLNDLPEVLYIENRLPLWGGIMSSNSVGLTRLYPMAHPVLAGVCYRGGIDFRRTERLHFELLRRIDPWLAEAPFLNDKWDDRLKPHFGDLRITGEPFKSTHPPSSRNLMPWQWNFLDAAVQDIKDLLFDSPNSGLFEIVDPARLAEAAASFDHPADVPSAKAILSLVGMQLLLTGGYTTPKESLMKNGERGELITNVEGVTLEHKLGAQQLVGACGAGPIHLQRDLADAGVERVRGERWASRDRAASYTSFVGAMEGMTGVDPKDFEGESFAGAAGAGRLEPPWIEFDLPRETIRQVRFDPADLPCELILCRAEFVDGDRTEPIDVGDPAQLRCVRQLERVRRLDGGDLYRVTGRDPRIVFPGLEGRDLGEAVQPRLRVAMLASASVRVECYWDLGEGFAESLKQVKSLPASPMQTLCALRMMASLPPD